MDKENQLTSNAILEISTGFEGFYRLQVISCRIHEDQQLHLCLTDGDLYIGAIFKGKVEEIICPYYVLEVECKFTSRWQPMIIKSLQIVSRSSSHLLGKPPITLPQYFINSFEKQKTSQSEKKQTISRYPEKKVKKNQEVRGESQNTLLSNDQDPPTQKLASSSQQIQSLNIRPSSTQQLRPNTRKYMKNEQIMGFNDNSHSYSQTLSQLNQEDTHSFFINDLYERMQGWKILCRVNYIRQFISSNGNKCKMIYLIDQKGDHIKTMLYGNSSLNMEITLGKSYSFSEGQICQIFLEDKKICQLKLDSLSKIKPRQIFIPAYAPNKLKSYQRLSYLSNEEVSVLGVIRSIQKQELKNQNKKKIIIKGRICHPIQMYEIEFSKFYEEGEEELEEGFLYVFHNFIVCLIDNTVRLKYGKRSYFVQINENEVEEDEGYSSNAGRIYNSLSNQEWRFNNYNNLSQIKYVKRTIQQMKKLIARSESSLFSSIACTVSEIKIKKQYRACIHCKRITSQEVKNLWTCYKCMKIVDTVPTFVVSVVLSDSTGSFQSQAFGSKAMTFLATDSQQLFEMNSQEQEVYIQLAKFGQFQVKLKTTKKIDNSVKYEINEIEDGKYEQSLKEIRRRTLNQKLTFSDPWSSSDKKQHRI